MRRDQRPVQVEPDAEPGMRRREMRTIIGGEDIEPDADVADIGARTDAAMKRAGEAMAKDVNEALQAHPVSHRQARENQQLASMKLEREALARRLETMAPNDHARITYPDVIKRYDEQIERFEQALKEGQ